MKRRLSLHKESLTDLTTAEILVVGAASGVPCNLTDLITGTLCFPTCGPLCTGTSTTGLESKTC